MSRFMLLPVKLPASPVPVIALIPVTIPVTCHAPIKRPLSQDVRVNCRSLNLPLSIPFNPQHTVATSLIPTQTPTIPPLVSRKVIIIIQVVYFFSPDSGGFRTCHI